MQLRTILARDMKEALATVRADMGEDAVIVSTEKAKSGGVIVRAALDRREEQQQPSVQDHAVGDEQATASPVADFETRYRDVLLKRLRGEAKTTRPRFERGELLALLSRHRLPSGLAHELVEAAAKAQLTDMTLSLAAALDKRMRVQPIDVTEAKALLLVGPPGTGKTSVCAKLAAHARLANRHTTLIATDTTGAGAVARLETFASHLDCTVTVCDSASDLAAVVAACVAQNTLVLIDTAGIDPHDGKLRTAFSAIAQIEHVEAIGVVSATNDAGELADTLDGLKALGAARTIVTGLDRVRRMGALASAATHALPLAQVTRSPFIASGLEPLSSIALARLLLDGERGPQ